MDSSQNVITTGNDSGENRNVITTGNLKNTITLLDKIDTKDLLEPQYRELRMSLEPLFIKMAEIRETLYYSNKTRINTIEDPTKRKKAKKKKEKRKNKTLMRQKRIEYNKTLPNKELLLFESSVTESVESIKDLPENLSTQKIPKKEQGKTKTYRCYVCKNSYTELHFFYSDMCPECGKSNYKFRSYSMDLSGRFALLTGGRVKIGFYTGLKLLRANANVIVTTRFPSNCILRYSKEKDFDDFKERLRVVGLDFKNVQSVENFIKDLFTDIPHLDILINNACQTIQKSKEYCSILGEMEKNSYETIKDSSNFSRIILNKSNENRNLIKDNVRTLIPKVDFIKDVNGDPIDDRTKNSWVSKLDEISISELAEVFVINSVIPFVLNSKLKPLLNKSPFKDRYIVNVSAMEGYFSRRYKSSNHPHTNMAKAALNMMTRTSAQDYAKDGIYMTSVDTGWINNENPLHIAQKMQNEYNFQPPLDSVDAASRILYPVFNGIEITNDSDNSEETPIYGVFIKDYKCLKTW